MASRLRGFLAALESFKEQKESADQVSLGNVTVTFEGTEKVLKKTFVTVTFMTV